jgi:hypothetical protein
MVQMRIHMELAPVDAKKNELLFLQHVILYQRKKDLIYYFSNIFRKVSIKELKLFGMKLYDCYALLTQLFSIVI